MLNVAKFTAGIDQRATLMNRMIQRLDIDLIEASHMAMGVSVGNAARLCMLCSNADKCRAWLDGSPLSGAETPQDFCPNANLFAQMPRRHAH